MALASARAQNVVFTGQTTTLAVEQHDGDTYKWDLYDNGIGNFATKTDYCPATSADFVGVNTNIGPSVDVKWMKAGIYFFKVTASNITGCTSNFKIGIIEVKIGVKAEITPPTEEVCVGKSVALNITFTGTGPWKFDYSATVINDDGTETTTIYPWPVSEPGVMDNPYTLVTDQVPTKTTKYTIKYTITRVSDINGTNTDPSNTVEQIIAPLPDPSDIIHRK